jgi:hypothetical protein
LESHKLEQILAEADRLYAGRQHIANVSQSIELLRQEGANCFETAWRLGRAYFFLGQEATSRGEALAFHRAGVSAALLAQELRSDRVEGHFWLGVNLALMARTQPRIKAISSILKAKAALQRAVIVDASYHAAGPLRVLARIQHQLPHLLGGQVTLARANFARAISIAPANTVTRIYFAELLESAGEITRARAELEQVVKAPLDPDWAFEIERDRRLAKEMLRRYL